MKFKILGGLLACAALVIAANARSQTRELGSTGELLDGIAAVVDDGVVLKSELVERTQLVLAQLLKQVQLQRAKRLGINVSDQQLNQALTRVAQNLGITLERLPGALAAENIDYSMYREDSRDELVLQQLLQRDVLSRISITPRELQQCLDRSASTQSNDQDFNISHILVSLPPSASQDQIKAARAKLDEIYAKLKSGEDFAQLAVTYSDAETALQGGSLGWRKGSELPTLFADVVPKMKPGEYSDPIQSASGFHIVKLNEVRGAERVVQDQVHLRHILLKPNAVMDDDAVKQRLLGIRQQIENGDEFGPIAKAISEDPVSAADGGDLGWTGPGDFVPEFEQEVAKLQVGELSQPFKTRYGWHLVQVTDRRSHDMTDELKKQKCAEQVRNNKADEERELWLRRLRDQAYVDVRL
jgi:peptidyl-prolyl cis-trans isomerase SurA